MTAPNFRPCKKMAVSSAGLPNGVLIAPADEKSLLSSDRNAPSSSLSPHPLKRSRNQSYKNDWHPPMNACPSRAKKGPVGKERSFETLPSLTLHCLSTPMIWLAVGFLSPGFVFFYLGEGGREGQKRKNQNESFNPLTPQKEKQREEKKTISDAAGDDHQNAPDVADLGSINPTPEVLFRCLELAGLPRDV